MEYFINPSIVRISVIKVLIIEDKIQCSLHFLKCRGQNRILWQSVDLWTMMPSLSRMIKDDSYCLGWLKEKSFVEQEVVLGCFSLSSTTYLCT